MIHTSGTCVQTDGFPWAQVSASLSEAKGLALRRQRVPSPAYAPAARRFAHIDLNRCKHFFKVGRRDHDRDNGIIQTGVSSEG